MIYSGADLIKTSGQQHERFQRLNPAGVQPVKTSNEIHSDTQGGLLRFARFLSKESKKKRHEPRLTRPVGGIPLDYLIRPDERGAIIDIYA